MVGGNVYLIILKFGLSLLEIVKRIFQSIFLELK